MWVGLQEKSSLRYLVVKVNGRMLSLGNAEKIALALYYAKQGRWDEASRLLSELLRTSVKLLPVSEELASHEGAATQAAAPGFHDSSAGSSQRSGCLQLTAELLERFLASRRGESEKRRYINLLPKLFSKPVCSEEELLERVEKLKLSDRSREVLRVFLNWVAKHYHDVTVREWVDRVREQFKFRSKKSAALETASDEEVLQWRDAVAEAARRDPVIAAIWNVLVVSGMRLEHAIRFVLDRASKAKVARDDKGEVASEHLVALDLRDYGNEIKSNLVAIIDRTTLAILPRLSTRYSAETLRKKLETLAEPRRLRKWHEVKPRRWIAEHFGNDVSESAVRALHGHRTDIDVTHYSLLFYARAAIEAMERHWDELSHFLAPLTAIF